MQTPAKKTHGSIPAQIETPLLDCYCNQVSRFSVTNQPTKLAIIGVATTSWWMPHFGRYLVQEQRSSPNESKQLYVLGIGKANSTGMH